MTPVLILSAIVFLPAVAALGIALIPSHLKDVIRWATLIATAAVMGLVAAFLLFPYDPKISFDAAKAGMQDAFNYPWIPSFHIDYFMGLDGISFPLVVLTAFISLLAM